jgi:hypothetical protein
MWPSGFLRTFSPSCQHTFIRSAHQQCVCFLARSNMHIYLQPSFRCIAVQTSKRLGKENLSQNRHLVVGDSIRVPSEHSVQLEPEIYDISQ